MTLSDVVEGYKDIYACNMVEVCYLMLPASKFSVDVSQLAVGVLKLQPALPC